MRLKRKPWVLALATCVASAAHAAVPQSGAATARLLTVAGRSVVAVEGASGLNTGFGFGRTSIVIGTSRPGPLEIITASGAVAPVSPYRRAGDVSAASRGTLAVTPLSAARESPRDGEVAYLLGSPLGYGGGKLRQIVVHVVRPSHPNLLTLTGALPRSFLGAPLVTASGRLLGAVDAIESGSWTLLSVVGVKALIVAPAPSSGGSSAIGTIGVVLAVIAAVMVVTLLTIVGLRRRGVVLAPPLRRADAAVAASGECVGEPRTVELPTQPLTPMQPLVRRREPLQVDDPNDFDIVVKSHEEEL